MKKRLKRSDGRSMRGFRSPFGALLTSLAILVFTLRVATGSRQALSVAIGTAAVLGALSAENLAPVLLGILFILLGRTRSALLAREELLFTLANPDRETLTGFVLQGVGYGIVVLGAAAWYSYSAYSNEHFSVSLLIQGIVIFLIGAVLLLIRPGKKSEANKRLIPRVAEPALSAETSADYFVFFALAFTSFSY